MPEQDLIWMSVLVFLPSLFALGVLLFPRGYENAMCWFSLAGTALTLGVAIAIFIHYKADVLGPDEANPAEGGRRRGMSLDGRVADAALRAAEGKPARSDNWLSRIDWIRRFRIQYYLGIDGVSLPLVLLTAF